MRRSIFPCIAVLGLIACSADPRQPDADSASARPAASPAASPVANPAAQPSTPAPAVSKKVLGTYKLRIKDAKKYYCTKDAVLGSHFEKTICLTEEQVAEVEQRRQQQRDDLEKAQKACGGKWARAARDQARVTLRICIEFVPPETPESSPLVTMM